MSEYRKHHYVPVCYQNNFANLDGLLWLYDRQLRHFKELSPKSICFKKDLYSLKPLNAPRDVRLESVALATLDGMFANAVRELVPGKFPSEEVFDTLAYFVGVQYSRLPSFATLVTETYKKGGEELMRLMSVSPDRMRAVLDQHGRETGQKIDVTPESMVEAAKHMQVTVTERPFLRHMFKLAEFLSKVITTLSWEILIAGADTGFILSDNPVVIVPPVGVADAGFVLPGTVKNFPLTRRLCLRLGDVGDSFSYRGVDRQSVRTINQNIAAHSERFIMGPVKEQLEHVVVRSGSSDSEQTPRFTLESSEETDEGSLQKVTQNPRRCFYSPGTQKSP